MVTRRPDIVVFDWKETGTYSGTTGRRVEGTTEKSASVPARVESSKTDFVSVSGKKVEVYLMIFVDKADLQGKTIPANAYITVKGERKEVVKVEPFQTHYLVWV